MNITEFDATILEELVDLSPGGGLELARELVGIFFGEAPVRMSRLSGGLAEADSRKVSQAAHAMRGGAACLGAVGLASACARIEQQARAGDLANLASDVAAIAEGLPALEEHVASLVNRMGTSPATGLAD